MIERRKGSRESGNASFARPEPYVEQVRAKTEPIYGGIPYISGESPSKTSKGLIEPDGDISLESQEKTLFTGPGDRMW